MIISDVYTVQFKSIIFLRTERIILSSMEVYNFQKSIQFSSNIWYPTQPYIITKATKYPRSASQVKQTNLSTSAIFYRRNPIANS